MFRASQYISLFLVLFFIGCKQTPPIAKAQPIDIEIDKDQSISFFDLTIYPIINNTNEDGKIILLSELYKEEGVLFKPTLEESDQSFNYRPRFFIANKSPLEAFLPFGEILKNKNNRFVFNNGGTLIRTKKITEIQCQHLIYGEHQNTTKKQYKNNYLPVLACPPIPLKMFLFGKDQEASKWLQEALPKLDFEVVSNYRDNTIEIDFFGKRNKEKHSFRSPMRELEDVEAFQQHFDGISTATNVGGCLVTYKGRILMARLFQNGNFFRKEWPNIIQSIYVNQAMGYTTSEFNRLNEFEGVEAAKTHTIKLWSKTTVLPKDDAYRGDFGDSAMELLWF